ncbi:hypothetical protein Tco_1126565 [Tanacetum coccineum]
MALPPRDQRHEWLRFNTQGYSKEEEQDYEIRLAKIYYKKIHRIQVLDFARYSPVLVRRTKTIVKHETMKASEGDFLGLPPSYTLIREPSRSMAEGTLLGIHFGVITDQSLQNLTVQVAEGPPREQVIDVGRGAQIDPEVPQDSLMDQEDNQPGHAPQHAPQMPQAAAAAPRTIV